MKEQISAGLPRVVISLTPAQRRTLLGFLQRASLTGRDVPAYTELFTLISAATTAADAALDGALRQETPESARIS